MWNVTDLKSSFYVPHAPPQKAPGSNTLLFGSGSFFRKGQDHKNTLTNTVFSAIIGITCETTTPFLLRDRDEAVICRISFEKCRSFHGKDLRAVWSSVGSTHTELPRAYRTSLSGHKRSDETDRERKPCPFRLSFSCAGMSRKDESRFRVRPDPDP